MYLSLNNNGPLLSLPPLLGYTTLCTALKQTKENKEHRKNNSSKSHTYINKTHDHTSMPGSTTKRKPHKTKSYTNESFGIKLLV